jgi:TPR repeat protein
VLWAKASSMGSREARLRISALSVRSEQNMKVLRSTIAELEQAAQKGSVLAQVALGYCYETGTGVVKKIPEAVRWYRSSAQRGSQDAFYALKRLHDQIRPREKEFQISDLE